MFTTKIIKSPWFATVSIRNGRGVDAPKVASISQGDTVVGEVSFSPNTPGRDIWMRLETVKGNDKWRGYWIALVDANGKVFASPLPKDPNAPPKEDRYVFVEHGVNSKHMQFKNYMDWRGFTGQGDPSVYQWIATKTTKVIYMWRSLQELVFSFNVASSEGLMSREQLNIAWGNLTAHNKALNNGKGTKQGFADFIRNINVNARQGLGAQNVLITGSTMKALDDPYKKYGVWCQDVEVADVLDSAIYGYNWYDNWHLIPAVTNSYRAIINSQGQYVPDAHGRKEIIGPFPKMLGDRSSFWLYMGLGTNRATVYADGLRYLDFIPERPLWPYMNTPERNIGPYEDFWDTRYK